MQFTKVFIVGLLILVALYLALGGFGNIGNYEGGGPGYNFLPSSRNVSVEEPKITKPPGDFVGNREVEDFREIELNSKPFNMSYISKEVPVVKINDYEVKNGLLDFKGYEKTFNLTDEKLNRVSDVKLHGVVDDTNLYGKLIVKLNGVDVFSNYVRPGHEFDVPINKSLLKNQNNLVVTAESSGWKIWAPTVYILKDLELDTHSLGEVSQRFYFSVDEKETPVVFSRIILNVEGRSGDGNLIIMVDGNAVFNDTPTSRQWIEFDDIINPGKNTVEMLSQEGTEFKISSVQIIIFYKRKAAETLTYSLYLSQSQYNSLPGQIKFKIDKVFGEPTSLVAEVSDPDGNVHNVVAQGILQEGKTISIDLPKDYVGVGKNTVTFSVTGDGGFTISDFRLVL